MGTGQHGDPGFAAELQAVQQSMTAVADALGSPLRQLVHAHVADAAPLLCAGVVLAAAVNETMDDAANERLRQRRIYLAAALEMLRVAHGIHQRLLVFESENMDTSVLGSTILAGDFCFSHSATLAAGTDSPEVVAIFAQALKTVSENNLKHLFGESTLDHEDEILFMAGVQAGAMLAALTPTQEAAMTKLAWTFSRQLHSTQPHQQAESDAGLRLDITDLQGAQRQRWGQLLDLAK